MIGEASAKRRRERWLGEVRIALVCERCLIRVGVGVGVMAMVATRKGESLTRWLSWISSGLVLGELVGGQRVMRKRNSDAGLVAGIVGCD